MIRHSGFLVITCFLLVATACNKKQAQAKTVIEQAANVQALMTAFDAKMVPNSVTVIDDEQ